jgi:hypothetical protein
MKKELSNEERQLIKSRKLYSQKIGHLAYKTSRGDIAAEAKLEKELKNNPAAKKILEKILKTGSLDIYTPKNKRRTKSKSPIFGSAFKPFSGGAPGLGRKS